MTRISEAVECLEELGYTVTPPEKPKVELPTEPGVYADKDGDLWILDRNGAWADFSLMELPPSRRTDAPTAYAPFTKLEPVSVTAKKVLAAVIGDIHPGHMGTGSYSHVQACIAHVAQQFGVTD